MKIILFLVSAVIATSTAARLPFARQQQATQGYNYPKPETPTNGGYQYPKPEQGLPSEPQEPTTTEVPAEPTTVPQEPEAEAVAEAEAVDGAQADQLRVVPEKLIALTEQPIQFQRLVYYPIASARLQVQPIVESQQYAIVPESSRFSYSTQVFQRW